MWTTPTRCPQSHEAEQNQKKRTYEVLPKPDNLIRYRQLLFVVACTIGATAVALAMSGFATFVVGHPILRVRIEKIAEWALPVLLIGIGAMILSDRPKDAFIEAARSTSAVVELEAVA